MDKEVAERLDAFCEIFLDELDRQEDMLALCKMLGRAALVHDVEMIEARTEAINILIGDAAAAEAGRVALAAALVQDFALGPEEHTLSGLIAAVPTPWRERMQEFQASIRAVLAETREVVRANDLLLRRSVKVVDEALNTLAQCAPATRGHYDANGGERTAPAHAPAFLDRRG